MSQSFDDSAPFSSFAVDLKAIATARKRKSWVFPALIGVFLCAVTASLLASGVNQARKAADRAWCTCKGGGAVSMALVYYADEHGSFPPAYIVDADGRPIHSWRAILVPYIDSELAKQYSFEEPWNGPNNSKLHNRMPPQFRCVSDGDAPDGTTNYVAVVGAKTMWPFERARKFSDVTDGTSETILVAEAVGLDIPWLEPRDLEFDELDFQINSPKQPSLSSHHPGGAMTWSVGAGRQFLRNDTPPETVRALLTIAGGEAVAFP
jgi:hypothetical protein